MDSASILQRAHTFAGEFVPVGRMTSPPDAWTAWKQCANELDDAMTTLSDDLTGAVKRHKPSEKLAMLDRSSLGSDEWRPVYADLKEGAASDGVPPARWWRIYAIFNVPIDEPEDGCSADGFMESSFLLDVDGGFYKTYDQVKPTAAARAEMRKKAGVSLPTPARRLVDYDDDDDLQEHGDRQAMGIESDRSHGRRSRDASLHSARSGGWWSKLGGHSHLPHPDCPCTQRQAIAHWVK